MQAIEVLGVPGSPYTRKMLALLRYRRIPHRTVWGAHFEPLPGYPLPKVKLLPTFYWPSPQGLEPVVDSTPIIRRLEAEFAGRSVLPEDPVLAWVDQLIEDFGDEWLTKAMFHYRWHHAEDAAHAAPLLVHWQAPQLPQAQAQAMGKFMAERQISRLPVVGSSALTAPVIESSYVRLLGILDRIIERHGFVMGDRPAASDFALYGQLTQLGLVDPTPSRLMAQHAPRVRAWLERAEDLSGQSEGRWLTREAVAEHLKELLAEIGRVYVPFLIANAQALQKGKADFETTIDGQRWTQPVFAYQLKCLQVLRSAREALGANDRAALDALLRGTGCEALFV